jgi:cell division protease FtsH
MNSLMKNLILWILIALILVVVFSNFGPMSNFSSGPRNLDYSVFMGDVGTNQVKSVLIDGRTITGSLADGSDFVTYMPWTDPFVTDQLLTHHVGIQAKAPEQQSLLTRIFISWFPLVLFFGVWIFLMRQMSGGRGGAFSFGKSKAKLLGEDGVKVTFADVAGVEEAKEEVSEVVDFLKDPTKYSEIGGKIPRGILMVGPPGTGKTLLARAIAGEAGVPFFSISGSDFVEMFVGVGAARVRDMFEQAKKRAPCIIFIDEIDAVGRHRGAGLGGGHDEREQTLNQMLVEMDGFSENQGVIVIAATNRPDVLDPALLRPGRFDRQVVVGLPDVRGREQILKVHMRKVALDSDVRPEFIARGTPGFSGADLANLVNEAALISARALKKKVSMEAFEKAKDKILMGTERRSLAMTNEEKLLTAYHEAGHAIIGKFMPEHDPVYKVSIIPRGRALGVTMYLPERDQVSMSRRKLKGLLSSLYGGRVAEELIFGADAVTTGASNDIQRATELASKMVTQWGLSEKLGPLQYAEDDSQPFLGHSMGAKQKSFSGKTAEIIDQEVRRIIDESYASAKKLLTDNIDILRAMGDALMKYETLDASQVAECMERKPVTPPVGWVDLSGASSSSSSTASGSGTAQSADPSAVDKPKRSRKPKVNGADSGEIGGASA